MLILQIVLSQLGQNWRVICWMLPLKFVVFPRISSGNQKPGGGMKRWTGARGAYMVQSLQCPEEGAHDGVGKGGKNCLYWCQAPGQSLRQRNRNSPHYSQMVMAFVVLPNRWTAQTMILLVRIVCTMMLLVCAHWRKQDKGMGWAPCEAAQCWIWVAKQRGPGGPFNYPYQWFRNTDPQSTQQNEM